MDELIAFFVKCDHLTGQHRKVAKVCLDLAREVAKLPFGTELVAGLRKLIEARDLFLRAAPAVAAEEQPEARV